MKPFVLEKIEFIASFVCAKCLTFVSSDKNFVSFIGEGSSYLNKKKKKWLYIGSVCTKCGQLIF